MSGALFASELVSVEPTVLIGVCRHDAQESLPFDGLLEKTSALSVGVCYRICMRCFITGPA
jgi:hypothetical protein